jgi:hypothetical protein
MATYDFSTLNDKDLEILVCDLLTRELSISFQSFKVGKDKGIDLRYSTNTNENEIIVQVKHYLKSGYVQLLSVLKNKERPKIEELSPNRYILVTSLGLSPIDKEKIKAVLLPYIHSTNDIYGREDLNNLITKYNDIETKHFKLWFSNTNIIQKILNNGIDGRSAFVAEKIKKNIGLYVVNNSFDEAINKLRKFKVLLITGIPGIGKTILADLITYKLLSKDFRLVYIDNQIREAEDMFDNDLNVKQLFYFDDFLGSNYLEIINSRNSDKSIVNFIERVKATPNKYLLLTTRTTILNQSRNIHERLSRSNLDSLKYEVEISKYSEYDKARILYNHLYFNELPIEMIAEIFKEKKYWKIIRHINYNPRLIEFFTKEQNINHLKPQEYFNFILYHLDHPEEIWDSAINNQLGEEEKFLLFTLVTFERNVIKLFLEDAFEERIGHEVVKYGFTRRVNIFNISFKNLLDGYITNSYYNQYGKYSHVNFVNPSLRDYLISYFNKFNSEKWRLIESFIYIEQFSTVFRKIDKSKNNIVIDSNEIRKHLEIANSKKLKSIYCSDIDNINLRYAHLFYQYINDENVNYIYSLILDRFIQIDWNNIKPVFFDDLMPIMEGVNQNSELFQFLQVNWNRIIIKLISIVNQDSEMRRIKDMFSLYNISYNNYLLEDERIENINLAINRIYDIEAKEIIDKDRNSVLSKTDLENLEEKVNERFFELSDLYLMNTNISPLYDPLSDFDLEKTIEDNLREELESDVNYEAWRENKFNIFDNETIVDNLFTNFEK